MAISIPDIPTLRGIAGQPFQVRFPVSVGGTAPVMYSLTRIPAGMTFRAGYRVLFGSRPPAQSLSMYYVALDADQDTVRTLVRLEIAPEDVLANEFAGKGRDSVEIDAVISQYPDAVAPNLQGFIRDSVNLVSDRLLSPVTVLRYQKSLLDPIPTRPGATGVWLDHIGDVMLLKRGSVDRADSVFGFEAAPYRRSMVRGGVLDDTDQASVRRLGAGTLTFEGQTTPIDTSLIPASSIGRQFWEDVAVLIQESIRDADPMSTLFTGLSAHYDGTRFEVAAAQGETIADTFGAGMLTGFLKLSTTAGARVVPERDTVATFTGSDDISPDATIRSQSAAQLTQKGLTFTVDFTGIPGNLSELAFRYRVASIVQAGLRAAADAAFPGNPDALPFLDADIWYDGQVFGLTVYSNAPRAITGPFGGGYSQPLGLHAGTIRDGLDPPVPAEAAGFGQAPMESVTPFLGSRTPLDDDSYRRLLRARAAAMTAGATIQEMERVFAEAGIPATLRRVNEMVVRGNVYADPDDVVFQQIGDIWQGAGVEFVLTALGQLYLPPDFDLSSINIRPVARAGDDQMVLASTSVTLDGSSSFDAEGLITTYRWEQIGGPTVSLTNADMAIAMFTAPSPVEQEMLTFVLTVTDDAGVSHTDEVVITVGGNVLPVARVTASETTGVLAGTTITLDGSASSDLDGTIASYLWSKLPGADAITLSGTDTASVTFVAPFLTADATYGFRLVVTDDSGGDSPATDVLVMIRANQAPTVNAGMDQTVDKRDNVTVTGTAVDPEGQAVTYEWTQVSGPTVTLSGANTATASFQAPVAQTAQTIVLRLTASDPQNVSGTDDVSITVNANQQPVARAGADQTDVNAGTTVTLDGSASSDPENDAISYAWTSPGITFIGADTAMPTFVTPEVASLVATLTVTDADGATDTDTVTVGVNRTPVSRIQGPTTLVSGGIAMYASSSTDPDNDTLSYQWARVSGTGGTLTDADTANATFTPDVANTEQQFAFSLTVTDPGGLSDIATTALTVAANQAPAAGAGMAQSIARGSPVTLQGTASDPENGTLTYLWTQTAGDTVTLTGADTLAPTFTAPATAQKLTFMLTVTDPGGLTATSTVTVTVLAAPLTNFQRLAAIPGSYVIRFTANTAANQIDLFEVSPAEGTLLDNSPAGMFTDAALYWIERVRGTEGGIATTNDDGDVYDKVEIGLHRGGSSVAQNVLLPTLGATGTWVVIDETNDRWIMWPANGGGDVGSGFATYYIIPTFITDTRKVTRDVLALADDLGGTDLGTGGTFQDDLPGSEIVVALIPNNTWRPSF